MWLVVSRYEDKTNVDVCYTLEQAQQEYQDTISLFQKSGSDARVWLTSVIEFQDTFFSDVKAVNEPGPERKLFTCKTCGKSIWLTTDVFLKAYTSGYCLDCRTK